MATDFGKDVSCFPDLDPLFRVQGGVRVLAEALVRRVTTAFLFYSESYGIDIREMLSAKITEQRGLVLKNAIQSQWLSDERVLACNAQIDFDPKTRTMRVTGTVQTSDGPFTLVADVTDVGAQLIGVREA